MKKKSLFFGFAAFVFAALIFIGCPQEADDDDPDPQPKDVSASYSLKASEDPEAGPPSSGVTLTSATELDGVVTLRLGGTVTGPYILKAPGSETAYTEGAYFQPSPDYWVDAATTPAAGIYAAVYIKGLFTWESGNKVLAIKNTNQALRLYTGGGEKLLDAEPVKPKVTDSSNQKTIWIPDTAEPVRWKLYSAIPAADTFGILIWNGGDGTTYAPKTARLELVEYDGYDESVTVGADTGQTVKQNGYSKTVVVDYSGVTFAAAVTEPVTVTFDTQEGSTAPAPIVVASGGTVTLPAPPTKANYDFAGWFTQTGGGGTEFTGSTPVTADITVYAKWTEGLEDVLASYTKTNAAYNPAGVTIASATKNKVTKVITLTLTGTVASSYTYNTALSDNKDGENWNAADWGPWDSTPAAGKYSAVYIDGVFTGITDKILAIKQTSQALRFYTSAWDVTTTVPAKPLAKGTSVIGIPADTAQSPVKWRLWDTNALEGDALSLLIWDGAVPKTVTFDITSYDAYNDNANKTDDVDLTIVIDYSAVTIQ